MEVWDIKQSLKIRDIKEVVIKEGLEVWPIHEEENKKEINHLVDREDSTKWVVRTCLEETYRQFNKIQIKGAWACIKEEPIRTMDNWTITLSLYHKQEEEVQT